MSGRGRLLERRRKRRAGEGGDFIVVEAQPPASTRYVNAQAGTGEEWRSLAIREVERHAGERRDRVVAKIQLTATQHQACKCS